MKRNDELRENIASLLRDWTVSEVLEGIAAECAYWKRNENNASFGAVRKGVLKTVALAKELGL